MRARGWLLVSFILIAGMSFHAIADPSAAKLLDQTIANPGNWDQMCASPPPIPFDVPLPLYSLAVPRFFTVSPEKISSLEARRAEIVSELTRRLHVLDLSKQTSQPAGGSSEENSGQDPHGLSGLLLQIVMDLNAVETLPELLRLETDLNQRIDKAIDDKLAPLPDLDLDSPVEWQETGIKALPTERNRRLFAARVYQRELLSTMATLLRHEKFEPLLKSDIEAHYLELLKFEKDPQTQLTWGYEPARYLPYTPELRREIRQFALEFLKRPPEKSDKTVSVSSK